MDGWSAYLLGLPWVGGFVLRDITLGPLGVLDKLGVLESELVLPVLPLLVIDPELMLLVELLETDDELLDELELDVKT